MNVSYSLVLPEMHYQKVLTHIPETHHNKQCHHPRTNLPCLNLACIVLKHVIDLLLTLPSDSNKNCAFVCFVLYIICLSSMVLMIASISSLMSMRTLWSSSFIFTEALIYLLAQHPYNPSQEHQINVLTFIQTFIKTRSVIKDYHWF